MTPMNEAIHAVPAIHGLSSSVDGLANCKTSCKSGAENVGANDAGDPQVVAGPESGVRQAEGTVTGLPLARTSDILRGILSKNPGVKTFSVERVLASIGGDQFEASLMMFSIPAILPVPRTRGTVAAPTGAIGYQMAAGRRRIKLPRFILKRSISRPALAVAIHAALPILEAAEKVLRPRWKWVNHRNVRRAIGLFVFVLALAIAHPFLGLGALHATSIFVMALGLAEQDGLAVLVGVAVGLLSLAILATTGLSTQALRSKASAWLNKKGRRFGLGAFARLLRQRGYDWLAGVIMLRWSDLFLLWNPEKHASGGAVGARSLPKQRRRPDGHIQALSQQAQAPRAA